MKKAKVILVSLLLMLAGVAILFFSAMMIRSFRVEKEQSKLSSTNFQISYQGILKQEAAAILKSLEENYHPIRTALHDPAHEPIHVFIHATQKQFNTATGLSNSTANGTSRGPNAFHLHYQTWFNSIFPSNMPKVAVHEFTHCVQLNILIQEAISKSNDPVGAAFDKAFEKQFAENYPQWYWEALCDYEAGIVNKVSVRYGMKGNPTLESLNNSNQIYNVGYAIIDYIVSKWGKEKLPELIRTYGDLEKVLGVSETEFEKGWYQFVSENY